MLLTHQYIICYLPLYQEEEEVEYTEEEEAIKANLETEEALSDDVLNNILPQWWNKEPFKYDFNTQYWLGLV